MSIAQTPRSLAISTLMVAMLLAAQTAPPPDSDPKPPLKAGVTSDPTGALPWLRPDGHF